MAQAFSSLEDLSSHSFDAVIDVRSPSEFAEDHLPGAINLPVLSDEERARVGTIYKQESPFKAKKIGAALVARNAATHIETQLAEKDGSWRPLVYCWRGGQRSGAFATILQNIGWRADTIAGGYKAYRKLVSAALYETSFPARVVLLDGNTGTGKTEVLSRLAARGIQTLDLEGLAQHRGSLLGAHGPQPSQKAFESALAGAMSDFDLSLPVLIEAESSMIGRLFVPPMLFDAMKAAPRIEVRAALQDRSRYLAGLYGGSDTLIDAIGLLRPLRGAAQVDAWTALATAGELEAAAAGLIEGHYDPAYAKARAGAKPVAVVEAEALDEGGLEALADKVVVALNSL